MIARSADDAGKLLLRLLVGGRMLFHGCARAAPILGYGVYVGEVAAPLLIIAGIWTRLSAVGYSIRLAFATLLVHGGDFLRLAARGAWAAELWVYYIIAPVVVAPLGAGRYVMRRGSGVWE